MGEGERGRGSAVRERGLRGGGAMRERGLRGVAALRGVGEAETLEVVYKQNPVNGSSGLDLGRWILGSGPFECPLQKID